MRAWAILMMLQGHFIDGLLDTLFRDASDLTYTIWKYFRGITAPVFFTVSGFIFTYLLIRVPQKGMYNPRVKKGVKRGMQLLLIGYLLRANVLGLLKGQIYDAFYLVDVLHCIGLSILTIIALYLITQQRRPTVFPILLFAITTLLFVFEPIYKQWTFDFLPTSIANYFSQSNGSVFTIIPWLGYSAFGGFLSVLFFRFKEHRFLYEYAIIASLLLGLSLIFLSSEVFMILHELTGLAVFQGVALNNYLFIRLGDVFVVFAVFMLFRSYMMNTTFLRIGQNTLSIYVIHFIILYGSLTGIGLYRFFHHELDPITSIIGAILFMFVCSLLALIYDKHEGSIKQAISLIFKPLNSFIQPISEGVLKTTKSLVAKILRMLGLAKG